MMPVKTKIPAISVVLPTYNRAPLLKGSIESVLNQTYQDFELIVVDDGSTDRTKEVVKSVKSEKIKFIRLIENKGAAAARNIGIKSARGAAIAFQDSDDVWRPDKLKKQSDFLFNAPSDVGMVYTGFWRVKEGKKKYIPDKWVKVREGNVHKELLKGNFITTQSALVRRECFYKSGYFDEKLARFQDWELFIRISKDFEIGFLDEPLLTVFYSPNSISSNSKWSIEALELILDKHFDIFRKEKKLLANRYYRLGDLLCRDGRFEKGRGYFLKAVRLRPYDLSLILALVALSLGRVPYRWVSRGVGIIKYGYVD